MDRWKATKTYRPDYQTADGGPQTEPRSVRHPSTWRTELIGTCIMYVWMVPYCCDPTNGYHGQVEGEEVTPGKEAREDVQAAHIDAAVQRQQDKQASCIQGNLHSPPCNL